MVKVNIEELLKKKKRSKYWLCNQMNITSHNLNKIILGTTKSISFRYVEDFCKYLECKPSELFSVVYEENNEDETNE